MAAGELLAVVGENPEGHPVAAHRGGEGRAHRAGAGHGHDGGDHDEPGVVVDAGDHLAFPPVRQQNPADQVHLPQVHGRLALPPTVRAWMLLFLGADQAVAGQHPVDRGPRRCRFQPAAGQLVRDPAGTPPEMPAAQLADLGFHLGGQARGTVPRSPGAIQQAGHALLLEPAPPAVQRLTRGAIPGRDLTDRRPAEHLTNSPVTVLGQLLRIHDHRHKHPCCTGEQETPEVQPNVSTMYRAQTVKHLLRPHADTGVVGLQCWAVGVLV